MADMSSRFLDSIRPIRMGWKRSGKWVSVMAPIDLGRRRMPPGLQVGLMQTILRSDFRPTRPKVQ